LQLAWIGGRSEAERLGRLPVASAAQVEVGKRNGPGRRASDKSTGARIGAGRAQQIVDAEQVRPIEKIERLDSEF